MDERKPDYVMICIWIIMGAFIIYAILNAMNQCDCQGCSRARVEGGHYCRVHTCDKEACFEMCVDESRLCLVHDKEDKEVIK